MLSCPKCDADLDIDEEDVDEGESVACDECGADLKVLGKTPLELTPADEIEDDEEELFEDDEDLDELDAVDDEEEEEENY